MPYQEDNGPPMFTYAALAAFVAFFGAQYSGTADLSKFYSFPWRVADGEYWRLITCTFLHGGVLHIVFNLALFLRFSPVLDNWLGPWFALAFYAVVAASSSAAQLLVSASPWGLVGASGVVYGLFGFLWVMSRRRDDAASVVNQHMVETLIVWLVICAVVNYFGGNIGNTAHAMGLLVGWMVGQTFVARRQWRLPLAVATLLVAALPLVLLQPPVWRATLGQVPPFSRWYPHVTYPGQREFFENPDLAPKPGFMTGGPDAPG
jgi:membrane associated rhomboid family serine protease